MFQAPFQHGQPFGNQNPFQNNFAMKGASQQNPQATHKPKDGAGLPRFMNYVADYGGCGFWRVMWPEYILERSQDLEESFHDAGQFYWGSAEAFLNEDDMYFNNSAPVLMPRFLTQDIDTQEDWKQAELLFNALKITNNYD